MREQSVAIPSRAGAIDTFITHPEHDGPFPPIIVYMDVWGVREELFDIARRIAVVGYFCLVPNFYYRQGRISTSYRNDRNQMITLDTLDDERKNLVLAPARKLTDAMVVEDTADIVKFLDADPLVGPGSPVGCIGYCMGGRHVLRAAAAMPDRFRAAASLHGTDLVTESPESPHRSLTAAQGEIYCGFGSKDRHTPARIVEALQRSLSPHGERYRFKVHDGADHGYALPDRDVFDKHAANADWEAIFPMFARQLRAGGT